MTFKLIPQVMTTSPDNGTKDIPTLSSITIRFNVDLHRQHLENTILVRCIETHLAEGTGLNDPKVVSKLTSVQGAITYADRILTFTPTGGFAPGMIYYITVYSDSNLKAGVRSVLGDFMAANYNFSFTTATVGSLSRLTLLQPPNGSVIKTPPALAWRHVQGAQYYVAEISRSNTFANPAWTSPSVSSSPLVVDPGIFGEDGIYYWRVRAFGWSGETSPMSEIFQFSLDRTELSPIVPGDTMPEDPAIECSCETTLEVLDVFPERDFSSVAVNLKTIYVRLAGDFDVTRLTRDSLEIIGESIEDESLSHGEPKGVFEILHMSDGTIVIAFTPDPLQKGVDN